MHIHVLQHVPFEGPAYIGQWAQERGHTLSYTRIYEPWHLPHIDQFDWLLIMGGPMSVHDTCSYEWMAKEKDFIADAIAVGKTVVGTCLGGQLIAEALGAEVFPNGCKEIGWFPVAKTIAGHPVLAQVPEMMEVSHWHGETFGVPPGAERIFKSAACANQGFIYRSRVIGLQFHLEATPASVQLMLQHGMEELSPSEYVQDARAIGTRTALSAQSNTVLAALLRSLEHLPCAKV